MPSTRAWCVFASIAKRSPARPSTIQISQSGLSRSACCEKTRPARSYQAGARGRGRGGPSRARGSAGSDAGRRPTSACPGRAARRRGAAGSAARGRAGARSPRAGHRRAGGGPSNTVTDATCMCAAPSSRWRKDVSSAVSRSDDMRPPYRVRTRAKVDLSIPGRGRPRSRRGPRRGPPADAPAAAGRAAAAASARPRGRSRSRSRPRRACAPG